MNLLIEYVKFNIFRDEHRVPWVHSQMSAVIDNECRQASCKIRRTSKARDSYKQCSIPNKSQAMNSVLKGFICNLQLCQPKADFDPAINVIFLLWFIDTPNNPTNDDTTARDLAWVAQHPLHVWRHRCEMDSSLPLPWQWIHSRSAVHPQIGFILDSSATSLHTASAKCISQPSNDGMAWYEVQLVFLKVSSWWEWESKSEERRANEPPINCEVVSILKKQAGRPFVIPCASWCEQKCVKIHRAIQVRVKCAKFPIEEALDQKSMRFTQKKAYSVEPKSIWWHSKPLQKLFKNVISFQSAQSASFQVSKKQWEISECEKALWCRVPEKNQCQKPQSAGRRSKVKK